MDLLKVGGMTYNVVIQEHFKAYDDDRNLWGYCDYEQQIIYIFVSHYQSKRKSKC